MCLILIANEESVVANGGECLNLLARPRSTKLLVHEPQGGKLDEANDIAAILHVVAVAPTRFLSQRRLRLLDRFLRVLDFFLRER